MLKSWLKRLSQSELLRHHRLNQAGWWWSSGLIAAGMGAVGWGVMTINQLTAQADQLACVDQPDIKTSQMVVELSGAVKKPGVYSFDQSPRVGEVIDVAGGLTARSDSNYVAHELNLAQKLSDGDKLYVPFTGEQMGAPKTASNLKGNTLISLNQATATELELLPGIGAKRAEDIIAARPFSQINELVSKKVVSEAIFDELKDQIQL